MGRRARQPQRRDRPPGDRGADQPRPDPAPALHEFRLAQGHPAGRQRHAHGHGRRNLRPPAHRRPVQHLGGDRLRRPVRHLGDGRDRRAQRLQPPDRRGRGAGSGAGAGLPGLPAPGGDDLRGRLRRPVARGPVQRHRLPGAEAPGPGGGERHPAGAGADPDRPAGAGRRVLAPRQPGRAEPRGGRGMMVRLLTISLLAGAVAGCAVGPDFHAPAAPASATYGPGEPAAVPSGQTFERGATAAAEWWHAFGSPELDAMVREALSANPDLKSADAALRQAHELLAAQRGALLPGVDASYEAQRAKTSNALSPVLADNSTLYSLHTAQVEVTYALDVFGGTRRAVEQAAAQALIANVIAAAVQEASLRRQLEAAQAQASALRDILGFTRRQADLGALGQADVAAAETTLAEADQAVPPLQKALEQQKTALSVLLGREAGGAPAPELD